MNRRNFFSVVGGFFASCAMPWGKAQAEPAFKVTRLRYGFSQQDAQRWHSVRNSPRYAYFARKSTKGAAWVTQDLLGKVGPMNPNDPQQWSCVEYTTVRSDGEYEASLTLASPGMVAGDGRGWHDGKLIDLLQFDRIEAWKPMLKEGCWEAVPKGVRLI